MKLRHVALKSRDLAATARFYIDVLGLRHAFEHPGMIFLESPGSDDLLNFVATRRRFRGAGGGLDHFGLAVARREWKPLLARLKTAKVRVTGRRGRWAVYVRDPNGYTVELYTD